MKNITFKAVSEVFQKLDGISSRNEMTEILVNLYKDLYEEDAQILTYLIQGRVAPLFVKSEFNYSEKSLLNLLDEWGKVKNFDTKASELRKEIGDLGDVVEILKKNSRSKELELKEVYEHLWSIINASGTGSVDRKNDIVMKMLDSMSAVEAKYFARTVCGSLRLGIHAKTLLDVFSIMRAGDKSLRKELDRVYGVCSDPAMLLDDDWQKIQLQPGVPVLSRLVERVATFEEVFERLGEKVLVQPKFDGLRCQIHKIGKNDLVNDSLKMVWQKYLKKHDENLALFGVSEAENQDIKLFTRNLEDVTEMFPEIVDAARSIDVDSFILDSEVLGWNYEKGTFLTYQETMQRRRKYDVENLKESIPVKAMIFDVLYINGKDLSQMNTSERIGLLNRNFSDTTGGISLSDTVEVSSVEVLEDVFTENVNKGLEGIIVKQLEGPYRPGVRNYEWIKLKKSMKKGLVDTVDMVVVGYYHGSGRRSDLGFGAILGALYNEDTDSFDAICKIGTGFDDQSIKDIFEKMQEIELKSQPKDVVVYKELQPDVWIQPEYVVTVEADEISRNISKDSGGIGGGLSLRFPRLVEFGRDKNPQECTSVKELLNIYEKQKNLHKNA
jgi:DNA ligase-1